MSSNTFYITTAISYPNGAPHIGHAYESVVTDAIARFKRLDGYDVFFLTGVDEHGQKMVKTAARDGITPKELSDRNTGLFKKMDEVLNVSHDRFIRTTEKQHHLSSQELWRRMEKNGDIYLDTYAGWYSVRQEAFFEESETELQPDGSRIETPNGTIVEWMEEQTYFFRLSAYQERLLAFYRDNPTFVGPDTRFNEVIRFVENGLKDLSISRTTFDWGIPVPGAPKHVMYVWVDALTNYLTGVGFPDETDADFRFWPADVHIIGKDIIRFHAIYWPAFLMSAGIPLPKRVFGHGFLLNRGEKMSKTLGNVMDPFAMAEGYGADAIRYFFMREISFGQDGSYSHEAIVSRINSDLANDYGNLAQRSLSIVARNCGGRVPTFTAPTAEDKAILELSAGVLAKAREHMKDFQVQQVLNDIWAVIAEGNRYFASQEPWKLAKTGEQARMETVLHVTLEVLRRMALLSQPFIPDISKNLLDLLGVPEQERSFAFLGAEPGLKQGTVLPAPYPLVKKYEEPKEA
ncbi:MAG: methionine--tRNA ligase [Methylobacteriaceae bacterium]|jgi:methionyl-tRNA synthetase|nr:methionine--tRNA ligase [Methylobacteriaceae bacterium]